MLTSLVTEIPIPSSNKCYKLLPNIFSFFFYFYFSQLTKNILKGAKKKGPKMLLNHNGVWTLTLYEVNGIDSTELINYNGDEKYKEVSFGKETGNNNNQILCNIYPVFGYIVQFQDAYEQLSFFGDNSGITVSAKVRILMVAIVCSKP